MWNEWQGGSNCFASSPNDLEEEFKQDCVASRVSSMPAKNTPQSKGRVRPDALPPQTHATSSPSIQRLTRRSGAADLLCCLCAIAFFWNASLRRRSSMCPDAGCRCKQSEC